MFSGVGMPTAVPVDNNMPTPLAPMQGMGMQAQPMGMQAQPMGMQAQPMGMQAQPMDMQAQPMAMQAQPMAMQAQPMDMQAQPMGMAAPMGLAEPMAQAAPSFCGNCGNDIRGVNFCNRCGTQVPMGESATTVINNVTTQSTTNVTNVTQADTVKYDLKAAEIAGAAKIIAKGVVTQVTGKEEYKFGDITQAVARKAGGEMSGVVNNAFAKAGGEMSGVVNNAFSSFGPVGNLFGGKKRR